MRPSLISCLLLSALCGAGAGCSDNSPPPQRQPSAPAADVLVRRIESDLGGGKYDSVAFELTCQKAGRLSFELSDVISTEETVAVGDRIVFRIIQRPIDGKTLLRDVVTPLFGAEQAKSIEAAVPDAAERRAREISMTVSHPGKSSATQRLLYKLPTGSVDSISGARESATKMSGEDKAELAHWAFMPRGFTGTISIERQPGADPVLHIDGAPVAADFAGKALFLFLHWKPQ